MFFSPSQEEKDFPTNELRKLEAHSHDCGQCTKGQHDWMICWEQKYKKYNTQVRLQVHREILSMEITNSLGKLQDLLKTHLTYCRGCGHSNSAALSQQLNWRVKCHQNRLKWRPKLPNNATKQSDWLLLCGCAALHHNPVFSDVCFKRWMMKQSGLEALTSYDAL